MTMLPYAIWSAIITLAVFLILEKLGKNEMAAKQKFSVGQKVMLCYEDDGEYLVTIVRELDPTSDVCYVVTREMVVHKNSLRPLNKTERGEPDMEENKVATDSSAPNSPELTRLSGEQAEERTAREGRIEQAREWMKTQPHCIRYHEDGSPSCDGADLVGYDHVPPCPLAGRDDLRGRSTLTAPELLAAYCSRLASRVEELENLIAKHSGCSHCKDSASGGIGK